MHRVQCTEDEVALGSACPAIGCRHQFRRPWNDSFGTTLAPRVRICALPLCQSTFCTRAQWHVAGAETRASWSRQGKKAPVRVNHGDRGHSLTRSASRARRSPNKHMASVSSSNVKVSRRSCCTTSPLRGACTNILILGPGVSFLAVWKWLSCRAPSFSDSCRVFSTSSNKKRRYVDAKSRRISRVWHAHVLLLSFSKHAPPCPGGHQVYIPQDTWRAMKETTSVVGGYACVPLRQNYVFLRSGIQHHDQTCNSTTAHHEKTQHAMKYFLQFCGTT